MFYVWITIYAFFIIFVFRNINFGFGKFHLLAIVTGILGAVSGVAIYKAINIMPASIIIPLSSMYIIITVLLSCFFLHEALSVRTIFGITPGIISIVLLAYWQCPGKCATSMII
jgi:uncharacterized membrane protein